VRTPAAAIVWEFRARHRWGFLAIAAYLIALAVCRVRLSAAPEYHSAETFAFFVIVPLTATFIYFLAVFSYGLGGDLAAPQSIFPPRMFTLPVSDAALAGWPMLSGAVAITLLWLATRFLALWPKSAEVPLGWPALLAASLLAWTQALTWMPYPLPGMRVILTVLWLASIDAIVMIALYYQAHEGLMLVILAPNLPLAFLTARYAVSRARQGGNVGRASARPGRAKARPTFRSEARAQLWFEWRMYGRTLPALVAILLPFELAMFWIYRDIQNIVLCMVVLTLVTPPFMAAFVAPAASAAMTPFIARRPVSGASLIGAKLKTALASTAAAWTMVLLAMPLALFLSGAMDMALRPMHLLIDVFGAPRAWLLVALGVLALIASTWKQLVQSLCIGMSGRPWLVKGSVFVRLSAILILGPAATWIVRDAHRFTAAWNAIPAIVAALAAVKVIAAAIVIARLRLRQLFADRELLRAVAAWDLAVFGLFGLLAWSVPGLLLSGAFLIGGSILAVPLVRLAAAPLAIADKRCG
jgi:hypothetical protein